jgi:hypothetical protein
MDPMRCLDLLEGQRLLEGALSSLRLRDLEEHLPLCTQCSRLVAAIAQTLAPAAESMARKAVAEATRAPLALCDGRFEVKAPLGSGGMGVVYEAMDRETRQLLALKVLRDPSAAGSADLKAEFRRASDLRHPNLVALGELRCDRGQWFFTMERVRGVDLVTYLRGAGGHGAPEPTKLRRAFRQLAEAVGALHRAGLVHRDINRRTCSSPPRAASSSSTSGWRCAWASSAKVSSWAPCSPWRRSR